MDILLDTHILFWSITASNRLSAPLVKQLEAPQNRVWLSSICLAELSIKQTIGKLVIPEGFDRALADQGFEPLPFRADHAAMLGTLELHHRDPFDRLLVAQCQVESLPLMTADPALAAYDIEIIWAGRDRAPRRSRRPN